MKKKNRWNQKQKVITTVIVLCLIVAIGCVLYGVWKKNQTTVQSGGNIQEVEDSTTVTYQGEKYKYNRDLKNIVFFGVDKREAVQVQEYPGRGGQSDAILLLVMDKEKKTTQMLQVSRDSMVNLKIYDTDGQVQEYPGRGGQSDAILLLVMDKEKKTTQMLQVSRDSMVNLKIYDTDGNLLTEKRGQLALQYAYGDGEKKSCRLARDAVSDLLYGIPISGYISLNMDGIVSIVDAIGGVPMILKEDYIYVDPVYEKGTELVLDGAAAERFVRYRDIAVTGSNNIRMERQIEFLDALMGAVKGYMQKAEGYEQIGGVPMILKEDYIYVDPA